MASLTVVQQWIGADPPAFVDRAMCRNFEWAHRHGYEFQFHRLESATNASWAASWERVPLMLDLLRRGRTVLWLDTDLQVIDHQHSWEHVLSSCDAAPDIAMLTDRSAVAHFQGRGGKWCCRQKCVCWINCGLLFVRPTSWAIDVLESMLSGCERYFLERQWDQDCLQLRLSERGALPSQEALQRALATASAGASYPAVTSRSADGRGSVCLLAHGAVAPSLPPPRASTSTLLSTEHNVSALLNRRLAAALRGGTHHKILPWSVHALQAGCKRGEGEACSKERIALPLAQADRALYADNRCA